MLKKLFVLFVLLISLLSLGKAITLSDKAQISVITCAPGDMIYECFGHTAVRVFDPENNFDDIYNYGIFEFNKPNFELNFAKGYLEYKLGKSNYMRFLPYYMHGNRTITEQILNLNTEQKQKLYDYLVWNEKPENRYYFYDYFFDNCATRVRDVVEKESGIELVTNTNFKNELGYTMRDLIKIYAHNNEWSRLGIDLCLGLRIDIVISDEEYCFLPDYYLKTLQSATINGLPIVAKEKTVYQGVPRTSDPIWTIPLAVFWLMAILILLLYVKSSKNSIKSAIEILLFSISGFLGFFLLGLWFLTDHFTAQNNLNVLWAMPLHIILPFLKDKLKRKYLLGYAVLLGLVLVNWVWFPQNLNNAFFPIIGLLAIISFLKSKRENS